MRRLRKKKIRPLGNIISNLEPLILEMVEDHDLQWGSILAIVYDYLRVHAPGAQEEYIEGGSPTYFYGYDKLRNNVNKILELTSRPKRDSLNIRGIRKMLKEGMR